MKATILVLAALLASCAAWQPSKRAAGNVRATVEFVKSVGDLGLATACDYVKVNKCKGKTPAACEELQKCHDVQHKALAALKLASVLADRAVTLLAAGKTAEATMYLTAALEVAGELRLMLRELGVL
jgi:hypothetical protein